MNAIRTLLFAIAAIGSSTASAADWPLYFDAIEKDRYVLVVLHEGGRAQYFDRMAYTEADTVHAKGDVFIQHDDDATWGSFPKEANKAFPEEANKGKFPEQYKNSKRVIWVRTHRFRFDYYLEDDRLIEFDKTGVQRVLKKRKNHNQPPK